MFNNPLRARPENGPICSLGVDPFAPRDVDVAAQPMRCAFTSLREFLEVPASMWAVAVGVQMQHAQLGLCEWPEPYSHTISVFPSINLAVIVSGQ
jgi:hypothetical protein